MVTAAQLLGIGNCSGGGSSVVESTVATGSSVSAGQTVSINSAGEIVPFDGSLPLFGIASTTAGSGAAVTITSVAQFAGTLVEFANASDLDGSVIELDLSTAAIDSGNTTGSLTPDDGIAFNNTGLKIIGLDKGTDSINEYSLTTAYDLTTFVSTPSATFNVAPQDVTMEALCITNLGTKLYTVGTTNNRIYEYTLATPYNVSTITFTQDFPIPAEDARGISISDDGKYVLVAFRTTDTLRMYKLSTPFNISTAVLESSAVISGTDIRDAYLSRSGGSVFIYDEATPRGIEEYSLSTKYDLSTINLTAVNTLSVSTEAFTFSQDQQRILINGSGVAHIYNAATTTNTVDIDSGTYVYSDSSGNLTNANTGNFVGFKAGPTSLILTQEPA